MNLSFILHQCRLQESLPSACARYFRPDLSWLRVFPVIWALHAWNLKLAFLQASFSFLKWQMWLENKHLGSFRWNFDPQWWSGVFSYKLMHALWHYRRRISVHISCILLGEQLASFPDRTALSSSLPLPLGNLSLLFGFSGAFPSYQALVLSNLPCLSIYLALCLLHFSLISEP